jgi:hypothetical protein
MARHVNERAIVPSMVRYWVMLGLMGLIGSNSMKRNILHVLL